MYYSVSTARCVRRVRLYGDIPETYQWKTERFRSCGRSLSLIGSLIGFITLTDSAVSQSEANHLQVKSQNHVVPPHQPPLEQCETGALGIYFFPKTDSQGNEKTMQ